MRVLKRMFIFLLVLVLLAVAIIVGGYFYIKSAYGVDLIKTYNQLKVLNEVVDESKICPYAISDEDMVDVQEEVNKSCEDLIKYSQENGYQIDLDNLPSEMKNIIKLSDRQIGAFADTMIKQEMNSEIEMAGRKFPICLRQVDIFNILDGNADINTVIKLDISSIKLEMNDFPLDLLRDHVPNYLYISSVVGIEKLSSPFSYKVNPLDFRINNLSSEDTLDMFHTLDVFLHMGTSEDINLTIGNTIMNALVGDEVNKGLAYSLKDIGANDFLFINSEDVDYFSVQR